MQIAVLGGRGLLGSVVTSLLQDRGHVVSTPSRSSEPSVDIRSGSGLERAVANADVVVHLASDARKPQETDVAGTRNLLEALTGQHLVYVSIVGVDRHPFPYYRAKRQAEKMIESSGVPHTILRATQFHDFIAFLLSKACRRWMAFVPSGFVFQPVSTFEVATELAELVEKRPPGQQPDFGGPEVLRIEHLARTYMTARGREAPLAKFPVPGAAGRAFRDGIHTNPERALGTQTWAEYLDQIFDS